MQLTTPAEPSAFYELAQLTVGAISTFFAAVSAFAAWKAVESSNKSSKDMIEKFEKIQISSRQSSMLNRTMQTLLHCNLRYHDLEKERLSFADNTDHATAEQYATRYWSLKSDQFDYWLAGFVDPDSFMTWFSSVAKHFSNPESFITGNCYRDLWINNGREYHRFLNPWFVALIDSIERTYSAGFPTDKNYSELEKIISCIEGIETEKGISWNFRDEFQKGMTFPDYKEWSKNDDIVSYLSHRLWPDYKMSCEHPQKQNAEKTD
jgi:hypothetical protein